ncbi:hypothetical protein Lal_00031942 [Lupinus albus]|nr:hypothetical protein Lal_00031942 [Lupinus albus]
MSSLTPLSQLHFLYNKPHILPHFTSSFFLTRFHVSETITRGASVSMKGVVVVSEMIVEKPKKRYAGESKGFVEEMRFVAMKLHTKDQAKEGEKEVKEPEETTVAKWEPNFDGYLKFLIDSKLVYDTLEKIVQEPHYPSFLAYPYTTTNIICFLNQSYCEMLKLLSFYVDAEFRKTGLERCASLEKDLQWFKEQGHVIPEPSSPGVAYAQYLTELSQKDPQAFICHFYNIYFAHSAGGRMIGKKVAEKILNKKELEFYKWDGDLSKLLQNVRDKLNKVAEEWSREEKNHCLEETEKSFKLSGEILRLILT